MVGLNLVKPRRGHWIKALKKRSWVLLSYLLCPLSLCPTLPPLPSYFLSSLFHFLFVSLSARIHTRSSALSHYIALSLSLVFYMFFYISLSHYLLSFTHSQVNEDAFCEVSERGDGNGPLAWQQSVLWGEGAGLWYQKSALHRHLQGWHGAGAEGARHQGIYTNTEVQSL